MSPDFPKPTRDQWQAQAEKGLKGRPLSDLDWTDADGNTVAPLQTAADGIPPIMAPRPTNADGRAWDIRSLIEGDAAEPVNAAVLAELEGGAASVIVCGNITADPEPLAQALSGVALELAPAGLDAGFDGPDAANALAVVAKGSPRARLLFHMDPISAFAKAGGSPRPIHDHLMLSANTGFRHIGAYPQARLFMASGRVAHEAGASAGQELGFATASIVAHLRAGIEAGMTAAQVLDTTVIGLSVDAEYFEALTKIRAMRLIWASLSGAVGHVCPALIEVRSSRRMLSGRDPWPNLLRLTAAGFAGAVGGADAVVLDGFSRAHGPVDDFARRQARNTQLILMEEAHLGRVDDPAAGSWSLDQRTRHIAQAGWTEFQRIEAEGGLVASLTSGAVQGRIAASREALTTAFTQGQRHLVGVTKFVDPEPRPTGREPGPHSQTKPLTQSQITPLNPIRLAEPLETGEVIS